MDIGIVQFVDRLSFTGAQIVSSEPRILAIQGADLSSARDVYINDTRSPQIEVVNRGLVLAEVPDGVGTTVYSLYVLSSAPTLTTEASDVQLGMSLRPRVVTGISALVQRALKLLLTTPGTDKLGDGVGGGLYQLVGALNADRGTIGADVSAAVQEVVTYMQSDPNISTIPADERLGAMNVLGVEWTRETQQVLIQLEIINVLGERAVSQFGV
jgi:hypothetical protein